MLHRVQRMNSESYFTSRAPQRLRYPFFLAGESAYTIPDRSLFRALELDQMTLWRPRSTSSNPF